VISGVLKSDATVHNLTRDVPERFGHVLALEGKTQTHVPELHAGDLGAVAKLKDTHTGETLGDKQANFTVVPPTFPEPVLAYAIEPKSRSDEDKIGPAMQRLKEEDPAIAYVRDPQTHELLLQGQGQLHIEVTVAKLKRRFGVEVTSPPRIPPRNITVGVEAHGRHKNRRRPWAVRRLQDQDGAGPRGSGFVDDTFGGSIPRQYIPVERHPGHAPPRVLAGCPWWIFACRHGRLAITDVDSNFYDAPSLRSSSRS
jgi:elongation factor G